MKDNWIVESSNKFKALCNQLQAKLETVSPDKMLDVSDSFVTEFQKLINESQQQAMQEQVDIKMPAMNNRTCPCCSRKMRHKGKSKFEFINRSGNISLTGIYYKCRCGGNMTVGGFVNKGNRLSSQASELLARYGGTLSFAKAEHFLRKDFGIFVSDNFIHEHVSQTAEQIKQIRDNRTVSLEWSEIEDKQLYGYVDGVLINIRKEGWKECKLLRYDTESGDKSRYRALLGRIGRFGSMVRREAISLNASKAEEIVFLMDGAQGFYNHISKNLPSATLIIDYFHACQHVSECANKIYDNPTKQDKWRSKYCHMLRKDGPADILKSLRISKSRLKKKADKQAVTELISYIAKRQENMDYPALLEQKYRVDSGPIESACKNVVQQRMKMAGMRWTRKGAKAMLEVRTALCSDIWDEVIKHAA